MGKKVKRVFKSTSLGQMLGVGEGRDDKAERRQMEAQRAQLNEQALAAANANTDQVGVASVIAGGSAASAARKRRSTGGPVSTSLGINV